MSVYLGIDFGTSTNYVTQWRESDGSVHPVPNLDPAIYGNEVFPNVIYYSPTGETLVGQSAVKRASIDPRNGITGVKRKLVEENFAYDIPNLGAKYAPVDVAADIFRYIRDKVSANMGGAQIDGVVISVPYAYGNRERLKIKRAAERAGLTILDLIEEPVAAAISFGLFQRSSTMGHSERIMVFDFGGGTLDITIFAYEKTPDGQVSIEVLNTEGLRDFGGQVIDNILCAKVSDKARVHASEIANPDQRLRYQSEMTAQVVRMKEESQFWDEDEEYDIQENMSGISVETTILAGEIEHWLRGERVLEKIRDTVNGALCDCGDKGLDPEDIDHVLLVGGSSNLNLVKNALRDIFGKEPETCSAMEINKMVGYGAGVYCGMKAKNNSGIHVIQKLSYSIGVRVGTNFDKLIGKNEPYGKFSKPRQYSLFESDTSKNRDIEVYQGNSRDIKKCFLIGKIPVANLTLGGGTTIEIALGTKENGMVAYKIYSGGKCLLEDELREEKK